MSDRDVRRALNVLELISYTAIPDKDNIINITLNHIENYIKILKKDD